MSISTQRRTSVFLHNRDHEHFYSRDSISISTYERTCVFSTQERANVFLHKRKHEYFYSKDQVYFYTGKDMDISIQKF